MEETTVSIPDDIKRSLKVSAKRLRVTEAQIIREALAAYVAVEP
ncbi:MAG: ribbon-helix-helix protein, CopG family, partial [Thermomicrobiales bacterium]|nr:ribbon-helix-helix protein, CopG family [Thermomicrobiales bacterium]